MVKIYSLKSRLSATMNISPGRKKLMQNWTPRAGQKGGEGRSRGTKDAPYWPYAPCSRRPFCRDIVDECARALSSSGGTTAVDGPGRSAKRRRGDAYRKTKGPVKIAGRSSRLRFRVRARCTLLVLSPPWLSSFSFPLFFFFLAFFCFLLPALDDAN